ncbi:uncharacterized protein [Zea mays]|uniref:Uncharacterized protein n=1 Tax=Zea mays TaxID=4577 RepID=A0A1D6N3D9_MAIZE|nr:uncharacterized protein LOC109945140 [Zea mays]ONM35208.1 hypothetical protein ZEAMMB73_Zm00001d042384 [Zea mays]ONM35209.1 hypothetical protein ZEAMMB73_Zm00001d042384 [Zea mays]ONM35210.1 hypothetical protein ZEAMMB73_Zm00001d042384 [Zea mays]|eukprot:XP_020406541.1 uncharacterized protein LOC109945140 [Zea mays]
MDISEGSIAVRGKGKNKRKWIPVEDDELIKALVDVSLDPRWRSDWSFKNGYTSVLEARLAEKLPDSRISATPHIDSRLRYFKTKYSALEQLLNKSGFTWDPTKKMIQCEKQQYETHCTNNPDAKGLYGVSFPYYDELSMVYSKDMATSEGAEDMTDAVQNLEEELVRVNANDEENGEDMTSLETPRRSVDSTSSSSKKRKKEWKGMKTSSSDPLLDVFNEVSGELKVATMSIGKMAQAMNLEASNQEKARDEDPQQKLREKAINEVRRLEFTGSEVIKAASVFVRMPDQMGMLFALSEPPRREYIVDMLRDEVARREREVKVKVLV